MQVKISVFTSGIPPYNLKKVTQNWGNIIICPDAGLTWKSTVTTGCNLGHKNCLHMNWILRIECHLAAASDIITLNWIKVCEALYRVWSSRHKPMKHKIVCAHQSGPSHLQFIGGTKSLLENWTEYKQGAQRAFPTIWLATSCRPVSQTSGSLQGQADEKGINVCPPSSGFSRIKKGALARAS